MRILMFGKEIWPLIFPWIFLKHLNLYSLQYNWILYHTHFHSSLHILFSVRMHAESHQFCLECLLFLEQVSIESYSQENSNTDHVCLKIDLHVSLRKQSLWICRIPFSTFYATFALFYCSYLLLFLLLLCVYVYFDNVWNPWTFWDMFTWDLRHTRKEVNSIFLPTIHSTLQPHIFLHSTSFININS